MAICILIAGRSLALRKHYSFALVIACIECLFVPFGTILGVFTIVALSRESVRALFSATTPVNAMSDSFLSERRHADDDRAENQLANATCDRMRIQLRLRPASAITRQALWSLGLLQLLLPHGFGVASLHVQCACSCGGAIVNFDPATTRMTSCGRGHPDHVLSFLLACGLLEMPPLVSGQSSVALPDLP